METTTQSFELGPVLPEPCGYFYRMGRAQGGLFASGRKTDGAWAAVQVAERGMKADSSRAEDFWKARFYAERELMAALGERVGALEEMLEEASEQSGFQIGLMHRFLSGLDDRMAMARYLERLAVVREIVKEERWKSESSK